MQKEIMKQESFEGAVSAAIRLGYDTDTTACVTGQLAGALCGEDGFPVRWLDRLREKDTLIRIATAFASVV